MGVQVLPGLLILLIGVKFLCPPGHALDPEHGPGPPHPPVPLLEARFLGVQDAILNIVRGRSTHGEECVSFDVKDLPTHEVQHMGPYFMDPASVPQPFRQRVQHGKVLVVPIQEGSRKRLVLQPVQPILLRGCSTPESSKVACDDYHVLAVHLFLLREVFHPKPLKSAVCIACDIDAHDAFLQSSCSISCSTSVPFRKVTRILSFARTVTFSTSW